jgi:hypothetical protein
MLYFFNVKRKTVGFSIKTQEIMEYPSEEKRSFPRVKVNIPMRYQIRGRKEFNNTVSDNISAGGIGFINDGFIAPKTSVMLEVNILSRILSPIGRIAWSSPIAHSDKYRSGVEFLEFPLSEKNYLQDYIAMRLGKL